MDNNNEVEEGEFFATPPSSPQITDETFSIRRRRVVVSDEEEEDEVVFCSPPPPTTKKENAKPPLQAPRSLARTGSKKVVRQVLHLRPRVNELVGKELTPQSSFLVSEWTYEFNDRDWILSNLANPEENVRVMLQRVQYIYTLFKQSFTYVSGVYIGKSVNCRVRFNHHMRNKKKPNQSIAMIAIALFTNEDVAQQDRQRWEMTCEVIGFQYERLLAKAITQEGLPTFEESLEPGGGGRAGGHQVRDCVVYMLLIISNSPL